MCSLIILRIKDAWYQLPAYRREVSSIDIYDAVLQHGVRTLANSMIICEREENSPRPWHLALFFNGERLSDPQQRRRQP
jgi:hypothetical protein